MEENLAKGYTRQFIAWYKEDFEKCLKNIDELKSIYGNKDRKRFEKFSILHKEQYKNFSLNYLLGGSNRHPFIATTIYHFENERYNDWRENHLLPSVFIIHFQKQQQINNSAYSISEHTIKRIYQRSKIFDNKEVDHYLIIPEMSYIPVWAGFYSFLNMLTDSENIEIEPIIPAPNGLFLCDTKTFHNKIKSVHVRTYVGDEELSETQLSLKKAMIESSQYLKNSLLGFLPCSIIFAKHQFFIDFKLLLYGLRNLLKVYLQEILKEKDDLVLSIFYRKVNEKLNEITIKQIELLDTIKKYGYRKVAAEIESQRLSSEFRKI
jgi:hypothetical protein